MDLASYILELAAAVSTLYPVVHIVYVKKTIFRSVGRAMLYVFIRGWHNVLLDWVDIAWVFIRRHGMT